MSEFESEILFNTMQRSERAVEALYKLATESTNEFERKRLLGKLEGVELIMGYIQDEIRVLDND